MIMQDLRANVIGTPEFAQTTIIEAEVAIVDKNDCFMVNGIENRILEEYSHPNCGIYAVRVEDAQGRQEVIPAEDLGFERSINMLEMLEGLFFPLCECARVQNESEFFHQAVGIALVLEKIVEIQHEKDAQDLLEDFRHEIKITRDYLSLRSKQA